jgi:hypothetical protein
MFVFQNNKVSRIVSPCVKKRKRIVSQVNGTLSET